MDVFLAVDELGSYFVEAKPAVVEPAVAKLEQESKSRAPKTAVPR
jgi:hypothetical protein